MFKLFQRGVCVIAVIVTFAAGAKLPSSLNTCKLTDPDLSTCIGTNTENALRVLKDGYPQLGIFPIDPLRVDQVSIGKKADSPIQLEIKHTDLDLIGLSNGKITKSETSFDNPVVFKFEVNFPELQLIGNYEADGRLLVLPLTGKGKVNITLEEPTANVLITINKFEKKGKTYGNVESKIEFQNTKRVHYYLSNLFNGDKALGDQMNNFMNENWDVVFQELKSGYEETYSLSLQQAANQIFNKVPFDEIFVSE